MHTNLTRSSSEGVGRNEKPVRMKARQDANAMVFILLGCLSVCPPRTGAHRPPNIGLSPLSNNQKDNKKTPTEVGATLLFASRVSGVSVAVVFWFVRTFLGHTNVLRLFVIKYLQVYTDLLEVKAGNLFVQVLGQHIDLVFVLAGVGP